MFHQHFVDNVIHRKQGKPISKCENTGTLALNNDAPEIMVKLANDNIMRDEWRNMMYDFWKDHCDAEVIYNDIMEKTMNHKETEEIGLEAFFA